MNMHIFSNHRYALSLLAHLCPGLSNLCLLLLLLSHFSRTELDTTEVT